MLKGDTMMRLSIGMVVAASCLVLSGTAEAATCKARVAGTGQGTGLMGAAANNARAAAIADWQARARARHGVRFGSLDTAQAIRWDCTQTPLVQAKCVVTARPCR